MKMIAVAENSTAISRQINALSLIRSWLKSISFTADGDDSFPANLSPDPADDDFKRVEPSIGIALVDVISELNAADRRALLLDQVTQDPGFKSRQGDGQPIERDRADGCVISQRSALDHSHGASVAATNEGGEAERELVGLKGLFQIIIGTGAKARHQIGKAIARRQHQDRCQYALGAQLGQD